MLSLTFPENHPQTGGGLPNHEVVFRSRICAVLTASKQENFRASIIVFVNCCYQPFVRYQRRPHNAARHPTHCLLHSLSPSLFPSLNTNRPINISHQHWRLVGLSAHSAREHISISITLVCPTLTATKSTQRTCTLLSKTRPPWPATHSLRIPILPSRR
ncbi:hypothetical protein BDV97DRAFT_214603 [Delphinella strobiligena]|nr:hypothetical protein BDV97DRAFT_214603 [Delphinella strobiligena]